MKMQVEISVIGMKANKGQLENGQKYDSTKVYALTDLDSRGDKKAKGQAVAEYPFGLSDEFDKFEHLPFPFKALAVMEVVTSGKMQQVVITELKPVALASAPVAKGA